MAQPQRKLRMGMVGGGQGAFIGAVHRTAAQMDGRAVFVSGCLSSTAERALASGKELGLPERRNYESWRKMVAGEAALPRSERVDFVSIVTPNDKHFPIARAFVEAGISVVCDKPLVLNTEQARELAAAVQKHDVVFAVTYNYSGYPLVKQAREMVRAGELGEIRKVIVEYNQGWLATKLEASGQKQADWRTDPARAGLGGAIGDIGSHAEQLVSYVTGLELDALCADLTSFVPGRRLDDDANVLLRFVNGAKGILTASQVCVGQENDLRLRVWGAKGGLEWRQEDPNHLIHKPLGQPDRTLRRGNDYLTDAAKRSARLPPGHPEAFIEAFANVYNAAFAAMLANAGAKGGPRFDYPDVRDGARGVHFIERVVHSAAHEREKWTPARFQTGV
ncbi:MAG: Gfo/Idh/MocA family oxidoreductase [Phycisphaerae bacterium]|nr:Gfo/Idh/MocA family oxidoreductase [Phycisphaerae bacterium]